jgi:predicted ATPase
VAEARSGYPWDLAAIAALADGLELDPSVTYLIGENGSGDSTLLEAVAVAAGMNPEGGSSNFAFSTRVRTPGCNGAIPLTRGVRRPKTDFFLRAESLLNAATYLERLNEYRSTAIRCGPAAAPRCMINHTARRFSRR